MNRLEFIQKLSLSALGMSLKIGTDELVTYTKHYLLQCFIRGFRYHEGPKLLDLLSIGDEIELKREAANPHDENCIALHWNHSKIGYIPKEENRILARLLDIDYPALYAEITHLENKAATWEQVSIAVYVLKETDPHLEVYDQPHTILSTPNYYSIRNPNNKNITRVRKKKNWYSMILENLFQNDIYDLIHENLSPFDYYGIGEQYFVVKPSLFTSMDLTRSKLNAEICSEDKSYILLETFQLAKFEGNLINLREIIDAEMKHFIELIL